MTPIELSELKSVHGATDDFGSNITENPVSMPDFHATMHLCLRVDRTELTCRFEGRDDRPTEVHCKVERPRLA